MANSAHDAQKTAVLDTLFQEVRGTTLFYLFVGWLAVVLSLNSKSPVCTMVVNSPDALASLIAHPNELKLGEAFIHDDLDVEGDLFAVFPIAEHLFNLPHTLTQQLAEKMRRHSFRSIAVASPRCLSIQSAAIAPPSPTTTICRSPSLSRGSAKHGLLLRLLSTPEDSLDTAQEQKFDLICRKLRLKPGEDFLDIGCGWGGLVAAGRRQATRARRGHHTQPGAGSNRQAAHQRSRGPRLLLHTSWRDHRELPNGRPRYDKIASVGMFEHVGLRNVPLYFRIAWQLLRPGGLFLNHAIARSETAPIRESSFIARYVFPDGHLVTLSEALHGAESQGFEVRDVENLREHYELTLRRWVAGLRQNEARLLDLVPRDTHPDPAALRWPDRPRPSIAAPSASTSRCSAGLTTAAADLSLSKKRLDIESDY